MVPRIVRLALELGLFAAAVTAYLGAGAWNFGLGMAALVVLHYLASHDRVSWLPGR
ncbi:MAG TPA: hypothetical protein VHG51_04385 [Longimicrobiaceae bacterium]|nr:hypothetical protein [Longimicrobiaceae bacterium]